MSALIKLAETRGANLVETMFHRQLWAVPIVAAWIMGGPASDRSGRTRFGAHLIRAAIGLTGMVFTFGAVLLLPLAEATTLQFTVPIFATILGALVLRETTGWHRWGAVLVGFAGVLIVAQPGSGHFPLSGAVVGLIAALVRRDRRDPAAPDRQDRERRHHGVLVFGAVAAAAGARSIRSSAQSHDWRPGRS